MASLLCAEAGWWQLELLLSALSQQAAAGVRPELFGLMEVRVLGVLKAFGWLGCFYSTPAWQAFHRIASVPANSKPHHPSPDRPRARAHIQVDGMQPSHARALHAAGLTSAELIGLAEEQQVAEAVAAGMTRGRPVKGKNAKG